MSNLYDPTAQTWMPNFIKELSGLLGQQQQFAQKMEPMRQGVITQGIQQNSPAMVQPQIERMGRIQDGMASSRGQQMGAGLKTQGAGSGAQGGATLGAFNNAAAGTNQFANQISSPEAQMQRQMAIMALINQAQSNPALAQLLQAQGQWTNVWQMLEEIKAREASQGGLGGVVGSLLGFAAPWMQQQAFGMK